MKFETIYLKFEKIFKKNLIQLCKKYQKIFTKFSINFNKNLKNF